MRRALLLCLLPSLLAADRWVRYSSGPFEVLTDAGEKAGQETMVRFQEFRHALGLVVGEDDLETPQPVRIILFKNAKGWTTAAPLSLGRDRYTIVLADKSPVPPAVFGELTHLLLNSNTNRMSAAFEHGLAEFFSTFQVSGIHITVGVPPAQPDLDWARVHLLVVAPENFGKLRILLYNLRKGVEDDPAYRNAFGKSAAEVEALAKRHFAAGDFQTTTIASLPMAPDDFHEKPIFDTDVRLARADLLAGDQSATEYRSLLNEHLKVAESQEGLGLLALREHRGDEARGYFAVAMEAGSTSARCYIEYARLERDDEKAAQALLHAAGLNPKLDEPYAMMAERDSDPRQRLAHWKAAAERDPRNAAYWQALAECYLADHNYTEAAKAWRESEQAATDPAPRARLRQARLDVETQRVEFEAAEKQRQAEAEARDLEKLKAQAQANLHAAEAKYNGGASTPDPKAVPWWDGPHPEGKITGTLKQVDCPGKQVRLLVEGDDHKMVKLLITDQAKIAIAGSNQAGANQTNLGCGVQKPRRVTIEYFPKPDARLATAGEVATIEFQ
jgi:tetratricopeptide (TPR) repeat protein